MSLYLAALFLGLIFNAVPGPIFVESFKRGLMGGYSAALAVQLGSLLGDATWAILGLLGIGLLMSIDNLRLPLGIVGSFYLLYLAYDSLQKSTSGILSDSVATQKSALISGAALSLTSPHNLAYWAAIGSALGSLGIADPEWMDYGIFFAGFMTASVFWCFFCAGLIQLLVKQLHQKWTRLTYQLCAMLFLLLALNNFYSLLSN
jgi:threonine/homoserine/homoserine lactone efflux protein